MILAPVAIYLEIGLLFHVVILFLVFTGTSTIVFIKVILIYIPSHSIIEKSSCFV